MSQVTQITFIHICVRENCAVRFPVYKNIQINYTYREFNWCLTLCDDGENCSNIKKPRISLLPEHQFRSNQKLQIRAILGKFPQKKRVNKQKKRSDNSIKKPLKLIQTWITLNCFTRCSQASLIFAFILELSNFKKE